MTKPRTPAIPPTANPRGGFCIGVELGTPYIRVKDAWDSALPAIVAATGCTPDEARAFLDDNRDGRTFGDDVAVYANHDKSEAKAGAAERAVARAVSRYMDLRVSLATSRESGMPRGAVYLTALVVLVASSGSPRQ